MGRLKGLRWIIGVLALTALGTVLWLATRPPPLTVQGEVSSDRVDISPRVAGRIAKLQVDVGDSVERGAVIGMAFDAIMMVPGWTHLKSKPADFQLKIERICEHIDHICQIAGKPLWTVPQRARARRDAVRGPAPRPCRS